MILSLNLKYADKPNWPQVILYFVLFLLIGLIFDLAMVCLFTWMISICFGVEWVFIYAVGVWLILELISMFVKSGFAGD